MSLQDRFALPSAAVISTAALALGLSGAKAALNAGMSCIAGTTSFTRERIRAERLLDERWIVEYPVALPAMFRRGGQQ